MIEVEHPQLSIRAQCQLLNLPRSSLYYQPRELSGEYQELMRKTDEVFTDHPYYGSRRISEWLKREGHQVGRMKARSLMRVLGIEAIYPRKKLSIPGKEHRIYPYLLRGVPVDRPNKVWAADITYIRLRQGFVFLVAIIDHYSRYILSWTLSNTIDSSFCVGALKEAIELHGVPDYFNTDQGAQFTCNRFIEVLKEQKIRISMDGKGRAMDNIFIERFWRTLKYEEVYIKAYQDMVDCRKNLSKYFDKYNYRRLHQSNDYSTPGEAYYGLRIAS